LEKEKDFRPAKEKASRKKSTRSRCRKNVRKKRGGGIQIRGGNHDLRDTWLEKKKASGGRIKNSYEKKLVKERKVFEEKRGKEKVREKKSPVWR